MTNSRRAGPQRWGGFAWREMKYAPLFFRPVLGALRGNAYIRGRITVLIINHSLAARS